MLRLPRKWVLVAGLLAATPSITLAGPFDFLKPKGQITISAQSDASNQQVAEQIAAALKKSKFHGFDISIEVKDGVATLSGKISDSGQKTHATKVVSSVNGVQSVDNQLQVVARTANTGGAQQAAAAQRPGQRPPVQQVSGRAVRGNQQVAQDIANRLVNAGLGSKELEIKFSDGAAKLTGALNNEQECIAVCQLAASVPEVSRVQAMLTAGGQKFDPSILNQIQQTGYAPGGPIAPPYHPQLQQTAGMGPMGAPQMGGGPMGGQPMGGPPQGIGPIQQAGLHGLQGHGMYNAPHVPEHAWPSYAAYDNYSAVSYPSQYDASAFPYIGPFYPYPQVPLGWREASLSWDDGYWNLEFEDRTDKWWWFLNPENWD